MRLPCPDTVNIHIDRPYEVNLIAEGQILENKVHQLSDFDPRDHLFESPIIQAVVDEAIDFFINCPPIPLPPPSKFEGGGVYALYFTGTEGIYSLLGQKNDRSLDQPVYIGQASSKGVRKGKIENRQGMRLYNRLREHYRSISNVDNLSTSDFRCRFILMAGNEIGLIRSVESALITRYKPLWNTTIDGFGIHDPGTGRDKQLWSEWDSLHPGRKFTRKLQTSPQPIGPILEKINRVLENLV